MAGECGERDKTGWRLQITVRTREGEVIHTNERILCVNRDRQDRNSSGNQGNKMDCVLRCPLPPPASNGDLSPLVHSSRVMEMTQNISWRSYFLLFYELQQGS